MDELAELRPERARGHFAKLVSVAVGNKLDYRRWTSMSLDLKADVILNDGEADVKNPTEDWINDAVRRAHRRSLLPAVAAHTVVRSFGGLSFSSG